MISSLTAAPTVDRPGPAPLDSLAVDVAVLLDAQDARAAVGRWDDVDAYDGLITAVVDRARRGMSFEARRACGHSDHRRRRPCPVCAVFAAAPNDAPF